MKPNYRTGKFHWKNRKSKPPVLITKNPKTGEKYQIPYKYPRYCWNCGLRPITDDPEKCSNCGKLVRALGYWLCSKSITIQKFFMRFQ